MPFTNQEQGCAVSDIAAFLTGVRSKAVAPLTLAEFIGLYRDELIGRCRAKVAKRSAPRPTDVEIDRGVPLFLDQLIGELRHGPSKTHEMSKSAVQHGHDLLLQGSTASQVVHDYGDVCQSITDLAME